MLKVTRTDNVQTEATPTGIITTVQELVNRDGNKYKRWVQVGYTSIDITSDGKQYVDGNIGTKLIKEMSK